MSSLPLFLPSRRLPYSFSTRIPKNRRPATHRSSSSPLYRRSSRTALSTRSRTSSSSSRVRGARSDRRSRRPFPNASHIQIQPSNRREERAKGEEEGEEEEGKVEIWGGEKKKKVGFQFPSTSLERGNENSSASQSTEQRHNTK